MKTVEFENDVTMTAEHLEQPPMGLPKPRLLMTVDEYLAFERAALERHVYLDGELFAMAGESLAHGDISVNLVIALGSQLKGTPCRALTKDTKVRSGPIPESGRGKHGLFSYPDVVVVCGDPEFHDSHRDIILNPVVVLEILSPSTEAFDRGEKFLRYQTWNPTLKDYLLISQHQPIVERFSRHPAKKWDYEAFWGLEAIIEIPSLGCKLRSTDLYDRITFDEPTDSAPASPPPPQ
jgi:Uma2 family endonuclease